jgi:hypothetical protein
VRARNTQARWPGRLVRGLRPDRNPLRRRSDRVETYLLAGLFVATAAGAPFAAQAASQAAYSGALRAEQTQLATRHQVRAVLTQTAGSNGAYTLSAEVPVPATWTSATGVRRTGMILALEGTPKGSQVSLWADNQGNIVSPPLLPAQVAGQGDVAALGTSVGIAVLYLCEAGIVRYVVNRRRMAAWETDWAVTAQVWNRQRW